MNKESLPSLFSGHPYKGMKVSARAVNASVRQQAHEMQVATLPDKAVHKPFKRLVMKERAVFNGKVDTGKLLIHHPAGAKICMPDLGIAHLALGQTHGKAGCVKQGKGAFPRQPIKNRGIGSRDGISVGLLAPSPSVHYYKHYRTHTVFSGFMA
jgi:hypothetical protein